MSMDGSAAGRSPRRSVLPLMVVTLAALSSPGLGSACTPSINIPANSKVSQSKELSLSLRCSVHLCSKDLPNVTWCRIGNGQNNLCQPVIPDNRISSGWENNNKNEAVHVLTFHFMHLNETGFYKCTAGFNGIQIVGRGINVILSDELMAKTTTMNMLSSNDTNSTSIPIIPVLEQIKILMYVMASAGGLCLIIIIISLLVFCRRRRREKYGSSTDPEKAEEVQFVATSVNPENGLELSEVSCPPGKEFTTVPTETTYDNAHLGYRSSLPLSPEEDSIIYADLNHEDKKAHFQFEEEVEVEYATVRLK